MTMATITSASAEFPTLASPATPLASVSIRKAAIFGTSFRPRAKLVAPALHQCSTVHTRWEPMFDRCPWSAHT
jgi:hypothetical protein